MNESSICKVLDRRIQEEDLQCVVHSVFNNSFNVLDHENKLITYLNSNGTMAPNSIKIGQIISFNNLGIKPKMKIIVSQRFTIIEDLNIILIHDEVKIWDGSPNLNFNKENKEKVKAKLYKTGEILSKKGNKEGIFPIIKALDKRILGIDVLLKDEIIMGKEEEFIEDRFIKFIDSYIYNNIDNISQKAKDIVGFGIGLTPSMDDFLSGMMISRVYSYYYLDYPMEKAHGFNNAIVSKIKDKTTRISQEMLIYSSRGEVNDYIRELMVSFLGNASLDYFYSNIDKVMRIGETSGTDILLGIYVGSCILLKEILGGGFND